MIILLWNQTNSDATGRIIAAKDHASVQIAIADVDPATGTMIRGQNTNIAICGQIRAMGECDDSLNRIAQEKDIVHK